MSEIELTAVKPHQHSQASSDGGMLHTLNTQVIHGNNTFKLLMLILALKG